MANLFKRAAVFTDLHLGLKGNSPLHNEDCWKFVQWFVATAKEQNCETAIICGDYHNHRASINILSLNYSLKCLELLNSSFSQVYFIIGNHDLYYRSNRSINSVEFARYLPNITVINDVVSEGDVTFLPWLMDDELAALKKVRTKYVFGHLELPDFYMNSQVLMPKHGEYNESWLGNVESVFTGHFHKRQQRGNITYIGNAFPHNYSDAGDDQRGMMILPWGEKPQFYSWPDQPIFRVFNLSHVLSKPEKLLFPNMSARITIDVPLKYEEANFIRETFLNDYKLREINLLAQNSDKDELNGAVVGNLQFESLDQIVDTALKNIQSDVFDPQILKSIYDSL